MLSLQGVEKIYTDQKMPKTALSEIHLVLPNTHTMGIIGKAKTGKTTLLRCISLIETPTAGSILFDSIDPMQLKKKARNDFRQQYIGYIGSPNQLLPSRSVFDNIALPLQCQGFSKKHIAHVIWPLLELSQLKDIATLFPSHLSIRQKQKVMIVRAVIRHPKLVLWDDVALSFDLYSTQQCLNTLTTLQQFYQFSLIVVSEALDIIKPLCHYLTVLQQGKIIETGSIIDLLSQPHASLTKEFIRQASRAELPANLRRKIQPRAINQSAPVLKITFQEHIDHEPVLTHLIRTFNLVINILHASLETFPQGQLRVLVAEIIGSSYNIEQAIHYLEIQNIYTERLGYVA